MTQNWLILALLAGIASNGFNIANRTALKGNGDSTAYSWWFEFFRSVFFGVVMLLGFSAMPRLGQFLPLAIISLVELISVYFYMRMHSQTELSISSVISRMRIIWSPLLAAVVVGERLTTFEYLGIILIFVGIAIVTSPKEIKADKGIKTAMIFAFSSALLSTVVKLFGSNIETSTIVFSQGILPLLVLPFFMKQGIIRIQKIGKSHFINLVGASSFNIASSYLLFEALRLADASKVVGVYQSMTLISVAYGIIILREHDKLVRKILGATIVILGILATVH